MRHGDAFVLVTVSESERDVSKSHGSRPAQRQRPEPASLKLDPATGTNRHV